jgi:hypothetical protein
MSPINFNYVAIDLDVMEGHLQLYALDVKKCNRYCFNGNVIGTRQRTVSELSLNKIFSLTVASHGCKSL